MKKKRKIVIEWKDGRPVVELTGSNWNSRNIFAAKRMVDRAYRRWQKEQYRKERGEMNNGRSTED